MEWQLCKLYIGLSIIISVNGIKRINTIAVTQASLIVVDCCLSLFTAHRYIQRPNYTKHTNMKKRAHIYNFKRDIEPEYTVQFPLYQNEKRIAKFIINSLHREYGLLLRPDSIHLVSFRLWGVVVNVFYTGITSPKCYFYPKTILTVQLMQISSACSNE